MRRKTVSGIMLSLVLIGMLILTFNIQQVKAGGTIYIMPDGSVYPDTAPISTVDNITYTFTDNIYESIVVQRDNIVVDGAGYTLQGPGSGIGIDLGAYIWDLTARTNVTIKDMKIKSFWCGIRLKNSANNTISGNDITANDEYGIQLFNSANNTISGNNIKTNGLEAGINLVYSSYNTISGNNIIANGLCGIYIRSSSSYNTISGNNITNNSFGILFSWASGGSSNNNIISGNSIIANYLCGIYIRSSSSYNTISGNNIRNSGNGIIFESGSNNSIFGNNITDNHGNGIDLWDSSNNTFYHNNLINNAKQVDISPSYPSKNVWDDGFEGNYWSDYTGVDLNHDGIGDSWYNITQNNTDHYPLMGMFSDFPVIHQEETFHVTTICNSTISDFDLVINLETGDHMLWFDVTGPDDTVGFCRIMIPRGLMEGPYTVRVDGEEVPANELPISNSTYAFLYFTYIHSKHHVEIIPEFPSFLILLLFMIATLVAVIVHRRRKHSA